MFLTHRIEEICAQTTDTRHAIGSFVLEHRTHLSDYTIADIARATYASKASVTRFAQALGYDGWRGFIRDFMAEVRYEASHATAVDPNFPFAAGDADERVVNAVADAQFDAVADTMRLLNRGMLELAVRQLVGAHGVWVFGVSPNTYLGDLFCRKMLSVGMPAQVVNADEHGIVARSLGQNDCALIISYSGNNPEVNPMACVPALIARKSRMVAITGEGDNYLRQHIRCTLTVSSREALYSKIGTFGTEASIMFLLNALFACYFARDYDRNLSTKLTSARALEQSRTASAIER